MEKINKAMVNSSRKYIEKIEELKLQLQECRETLSAIQKGEVDALVVDTKTGENVYTLKSAEQTYRILVEQMHEGAVITNTEGMILFSNESFLEMVRAGTNEVLGNAFSGFLNKEDMPLFMNLFNRGLKSGENADIELRRTDGKLLPCRVSITPLLMNEIKGAGIIVTDLTETLSEKRFRSVLENSQNVAYRLNLQTGRFEYISPSIKKIMGFSVSELMKMNNEVTTDMIHPDDIPKVMKVFENLEETGNTEVEYRQRTRSGDYKWLSNQVTLIKDAGGRPLYRDGNIRDITEQKKAEEILKRDKETLERIIINRTESLMKVHRELEKAKRLSDIGMLAATVAHELRNPLAGIKLANYNIRRKCRNKEDIDKHIITIDKKVDDSNQIINDLLTFSKIKEPQCRKINISEILREAGAHATARFMLGEGSIKFIFDKDFSATDIMADPVQINEVINNILNNAVYSILNMEKGKIEIYGKTLEESLEVRFKDTGAGMDQETLSKIFEPFFTTKSKGTGLGLTVVKQILDNHNGDIRVESVRGQGTTIIITLPKNMDKNMQPAK